jgi:hypothetical protein
VRPEFKAERVSVVRFGDEKLLGQHQGEDVRLARKVLASFKETVDTLVHEASHDEGGDGTKAFEDRVTDTLARIIEFLWK